MLPGISAEDCLFADLGFDPAVRGCQTFEATDFLLRQPRFEPGEPSSSCGRSEWWAIRPSPPRAATGRKGCRSFGRLLLGHYPPHHEVVVYAASQFSRRQAHHPERCRWRELGAEALPTIATLYIPPHGEMAE